MQDLVPVSRSRLAWPVSGASFVRGRVGELATPFLFPRLDRPECGPKSFVTMPGCPIKRLEGYLRSGNSCRSNIAGLANVARERKPGLASRHRDASSRRRSRKTRLERIAAGSAIAEEEAVGIERRNAAQVGIQNLGPFGELAAPDHVDHSLHRLAFIYRVGQHAFQLRT